MRINQFVASASGLSRRSADVAVAAGRVTTTSRIVATGEQAPDEPVFLDGNPLTLPQKFTYVLFNKPVGYVSSRARQGDSPTLYDLLPKSFHQLRITGRLDLDSSGLVILTDDGDFIYRYTHPSQGHIKTYDIALDKPITASATRHLKSGIALPDGISNVTLKSQDGPRITVTLQEGRNRQLRRTFDALGYKVVSLQRTSIGQYQLAGIEPGHYKTLEQGTD